MKNWKINKYINKLDSFQKINFKYFIIIFLLLLILIFGFTLLGISINLEKNSLIIGIWGEYINQKLLQEFEKKYGIKTTIINYNSNENLYQKLKQVKIDLFVPSDYFLDYMVDNNWIEELDFNKLNFNKTNYLQSINSIIERSDYNNKILKYGMPYFWGYNGLVFKNNKIYEDVLNIVGEDAIKDQSFLYNEEINNKYNIGIVDDQSFLIPIGMKKIGKNYIIPKNKNEIKNALNSLKDTIKSWIITDDVDNYEKFISDQIDISLTYSGWLNLLYTEENLNVKVVFLKQSYIWIDFFAINNFSEKKDLSYKFLDFIFKKNNQIENMKTIGDFSVNKDAFNFAINSNNSIINENVLILDKLETKELEYNLVSSKMFLDTKKIYDEFRSI